MPKDKTKQEYADLVEFRIFKDKKKELIEDLRKGNYTAGLVAILHNQFLIMEKLNSLERTKYAKQG